MMWKLHNPSPLTPPDRHDAARSCRNAATELRAKSREKTGKRDHSATESEGELSEPQRRGVRTYCKVPAKAKRLANVFLEDLLVLIVRTC